MAAGGYDDTNLIYNPSTDTLAATTFQGNASSANGASSTFFIPFGEGINFGHDHGSASTNYIRRIVGGGFYTNANDEQISFGGPDTAFGTDSLLADYLSFNYNGGDTSDPTEYFIHLYKSIQVLRPYPDDDKQVMNTVYRIKYFGNITGGHYVLYAGAGDIAWDFTNQTGVFGTSDVRLKDVLGSFDALDKIKNLNLVKYKYNDDYNECMCCYFKDNNFAIDGSTETTNELHQSIETSVHSQCDKENYGVIAQEIKDDFPDVIGYSSVKVPDTENEYYYTVNYTNFIPHLLKSVQELATLVEDLKTENATIKARLDVLENPTT